jgi:NADH-quinone oxidoreductase subunit C
MTDALKDQAKLRDRVRERFPELSAEPGIDFPVLTVPASALIETMTALRDDLGFNMLTDITGVDWLPSHPRYHVNYHLLAIPGGERLRVKVQLDDVDTPQVPSVTGVWPSANWPEREVYDFFGIDFTGHPNMTRILMPDEWVGYPLRKDYPVGGVPVEYRMEPAYVGENVVPAQARPAAGGVPARLRRDRGRQSHMTWTGPPASGVRKTEPIEGHGPSEEGKED